jgi:hypothetical protein
LSDVRHRWINPAREQAAADVSGGDTFFSFRNSDRLIQIKEARELRRAP